jgi:hypothetical protein
MVNYEEAIKKPFTDLAKLVIGVVLSLIPIIQWFAKGFILECSGLGKTKPSKKMPEWKNWGQLFIKGLVLDIIMLIYAIPAILVFVLGAGLTISSLFNAFMTKAIPSETWASIGAGETSLRIVGKLILQNLALSLPAIIQLTPVFIFAFILLLIGFYLAPMAVLNYVKTNKFGEAFSLGKIWKKAFTGKYFTVWLVTIILTVFITTILSLIPIVGWGAAFFISGVIAYSLYGQVYREV